MRYLICCALGILAVAHFAPADAAGEDVTLPLTPVAHLDSKDYSSEDFQDLWECLFNIRIIDSKLNPNDKSVIYFVTRKIVTTREQLRRYKMGATFPDTEAYFITGHGIFEVPFASLLNKPRPYLIDLQIGNIIRRFFVYDADSSSNRALELADISDSRGGYLSRRDVNLERQLMKASAPIAVVAKKQEPMRAETLQWLTYAIWWSYAAMDPMNPLRPDATKRALLNKHYQKAERIIRKARNLKIPGPWDQN